MSDNNKDKVCEGAEEDGIIKPSGLAVMAFGPFFLAAVPLTSYITKPGGYVQTLIETALKLIPGGSIPADRMIPAMSAIYYFFGHLLALAQSQQPDRQRLDRRDLTTMNREGSLIT